MTRRLAIICAVFLVSIGCSQIAVDNPMGAESHARARNLPAPVDMTWQGFSVHLDPYVLLWAKDSHIDLRRVVTGALSKIEGRLHASPATIGVDAGSVYAIPSVGIGGITDRYTGRVQISMDSRSPLGLREMLTIWLPMSLAHELHHSKRILDGPGYGDTLGEAIVTEGSAEAFVREIFPNAPAIPWVQPMSASEAARVRRSAWEKLDAPDDPPLHEAWFYGGGQLPRWAGYKLGYVVAESYLSRHRDVTAADLAMKPARDVLKG